MSATTTIPSALHALADRVGILPEYVDQTGRERRVTSDETRVAILAAMGIDASTDDAAERALRELEARDAERLLPPVCVLVRRAGSEGSPPSTRVTIPPRWRGRALSWSAELRTEEGAARRTTGTVSAGSASAFDVALPADLGLGYHTLRLTARAGRDERTVEQSLVLVPRACPSPHDLLGGERVFGVTANLYTVRSARNWGAGDFTDLGELLAWGAGVGAAFVGVNPLHALRNREQDISPYSPVSRLFRNPLYLDVDAVPELAESAEARAIMADADFRAELARLRESRRVEYAQVMALKRPVLEALHRTFVERRRGGESARGRAYAAYLETQGAALTDFATFCALEQIGPEGGSYGWWREWPEAYHDPRSPAVARFREEHAALVDFHRWIQFELDAQLAAAAGRARDGGMPVGLYQDLAIGTSSNGSDVWMFPSLFLDGVCIGAPPDDLGPTGQNWGLPPIDPRRLTEDGYRYWITLLRGAFRHAGALRLDHVLGLFRQFWIPAGRPGSEGAYVRFPTEDLLGILALESTRNGALVVGEDLGTVPPEVPPTLERWSVLSSKVLLFERSEEDDGYCPSSSYPPMALATANTHDMPTLAGWWKGRDVDLRQEVGPVESQEAVDAAYARRAGERAELVRALASEGLLATDDESLSPSSVELRAAVHAFLRRTPSWLIGLSLDDLVGETEPVNIPGVSPEHFSSWTRRLTVGVEELRSSPDVARALGGKERTRGAERGASSVISDQRARAGARRLDAGDQRSAISEGRPAASGIRPATGGERSTVGDLEEAIKDQQKKQRSVRGEVF
jgi:4-alpha-glucanotransferase